MHAGLLRLDWVLDQVRSNHYVGASDCGQSLKRPISGELPIRTSVEVYDLHDYHVRHLRTVNIHLPLYCKVKGGIQDVLIGELAGMTGLTTKAIRFYEAQGLLPSPARTPGGYRDYGRDAMARISFISAGQAIGFTLGELREVIAFRDHGQAPCAHVAALLEQKAQEVDLRLAELVQVRETLRGLRERAAHLDPAECPQTSVCHLILPKLPVNGRS